MPDHETIEHFREKTPSELNELEAKLRRDLWKRKFNNYAGQLDDTSSIKKLRRQIARVKTIHSQRRVNQMQSAGE